MRYEVKATPNSREASVVEEGTRLKVKIDAPPVDGKANRRLIEILSDHFDVPKSEIKIVFGYASRNKIVEILSE